MKSNVFCIPILVTMALSLVQADTKGPRGVAPSRTKLYSADGKGNWRCLDGSKTISFNAVNDDYCDCPDGSDEPGTSACGNAYFYCHNIGHVPSYIKTSRLNDGICDPECCDGSDEFDGKTIHCPNVCQEVGAEARKERERVRKVEKEGGKIREGYIAHGRSTKKHLQEQLDKLRAKAVQIKQAATDAQDALSKAKAKQQENMESSNADIEAALAAQLAPLIELQNQRLVYANEIKSRFRKALDDLKENHNKNYHDLAVKATITRFDEYLEELRQEAADEEERIKNAVKKAARVPKAVHEMRDAQDQTYDVRKEIGRMFQLIKSMKEGYNTEYNDEAVLKAIKVLDEFAPSWQDDQNEFVGEEVIEFSEEVVEVPQVKVEENKHTLSSLYDRAQELAKSAGLGFLFGAVKTESEITQDLYNKASEKERKTQDEINDVERKLNMDYGKDEAFAQLADQCFDFKDAEYTYSVCLFGNANQKSNTDTFLGKFSSWDGENYDAQLYTGGTKCWNGPERSVKLVMSCGAKNEIVAVSEPNKCEYLLKFRTPAVCKAATDTNAAEDPDVVPEATMPGTVSGSGVAKKHDEL